ncbi:MAG: DNA methyltransferase [Ktedonobacteraceae bacterium]
MNVIDQAFGDNWAMYRGDCVEVTKGMPHSSVDFSIFSPPFSNLYCYSDSERDAGNCAGDDEFFTHFDFLIPELLRVTRPGRLCAVHCKQLVSYKGRDGTAGLRDFRGEIIRHFSAAGWQYHSEVCIWKDPVIEMQRTKAHGLLYKQLRADSSFSRQGLPEYLLMFRKWPQDESEEEQIVPVTHTKDDFPLEMWQRYASPVWFDIRQTRVLNVQVARESQDEKHICLVRGSLVLTRDGYTPIENVQVGDLVLTHMGRWSAVTAKSCTGTKAVVRVTAQGVADLRCTPDHQVWTRRGRTDHPRRIAKSAQPEWMAASETLGSYVNLKLHPIEESPLSTDEWWIVGRWLGDGHLSVRGLPHISCNHLEAEELVARLGAHTGAVNRNATATQIYIKDRAGQVGGRIHNMIRRCGSGAANKRVPVEALALCPEKAEALLSGYLSADGHYVAKYDRWTASSVSRPLLLGMALVAQRARGVVASVYAGRAPGKSIIQGRTVETKQDWIFAFRNSPGYLQSGWIEDDGAWKKVRDIQPAGESEVWDIQVAEDASFTAEGCIVHNCPLQLDVIERAIQLWTNPGDVVFSPFAGIGSEPYVALDMGRKAVGIELKESYFQVSCKNLREMEMRKTQTTLFDFAEEEALA